MEWAVGKPHDLIEWPDETDTLPPICLRRFKAALFTFPSNTGLGWGGIHPRALLRLPDEVLYRWIALMRTCGQLGVWPESMGVGIIVLLAKADGGWRPIGLLPHLVRTWMRVRRDVAKDWESHCNRKYLYAGVGKGSTVAAWKQAARAEIAAATGKDYAQSLLDLIKAFERVPYRVLRREASRLGYPLRMLRLTIAAYKRPRVLRVGDAISDIVLAIRGRVAGSGDATTEMRLGMINILDEAIVVHPSVEPTLFWLTMSRAKKTAKLTTSRKS